jgi:dihydrofolate reductase
MCSVIYSMSVSLDGYIAGPDGSFDWTTPDEEVFGFFTDQTRELAAHIVNPVVTGGGIPFYPQCERRLDLELIESPTFSSRVVYLRYRVAH